MTKTISRILDELEAGAIPPEPKILVLDIETKPIIAYTWTIGEVHLGLESIIEDWSILCVAWRWTHEKKTHVLSLKKQSDYTDDTVILDKLHSLLDEADIVVTQNGQRFDIPKINARMIQKQYYPYSPVKHWDTLKMSRRVASFTSHKLAHMSSVVTPHVVKSDHKEFPGMSLWTSCLAGDKTAWGVMEEYNVRDVDATLELFRSLAPWVPGLQARFYCGCRSCGCDLVKRGLARSNAGVFQRFVCSGCGSWSRSKVNLLSVDFRKELVVSG
jgi:RNase_H superfamily